MRRGLALAVRLAAVGGVALIGMSIAGAPVWAAGDAEKGREVALRYCGRCHVVDDANPYAGIDTTPKFSTFARRPDIYPDARIRTFSERPPHPPQKIAIKPAEMDDLLAYVAALRARRNAGDD